MTVAAGIALLALASRELHPLEPARRFLSRLWLLLPRRRSAVRRWRPPGLPTILDRYVVTRYLTFLVIALAALLSWELIGLLNAVIGDAFERDIATSTVLRYLGLSIPAFTAQMLPLATLTATLVTFGLLSRHNEVTAFLAGGISRARLVAPALATGLLVSARGFRTAGTADPPDGARSRRHWRPHPGRGPAHRQPAGKALGNGTPGTDLPLR